MACRPSPMWFKMAIKKQEPVELLESIRSEPCFYGEPEDDDLYYSPAFALSFAIEYGHEAYARHLLTHYPEESMNVPRLQNYAEPCYAYPLGLAVICNQLEIMKIILETAQKLHLSSYINLEFSFFSRDRSTALHLACEHLRGDLMIVLLCHGASAWPNKRGETPMDVILFKIASSRDHMRQKIKCLDHLLLFGPLTFRMRLNLKENHQDWAAILGEDVYAYLLGKRPAPLALMSMKRVLQQLPPWNLIRSLQQLNIPHIVRNSFSLAY